MAHNRCSASFAGAVGLVSDARDSFAGSVTVRGAAAVRADAVVANHNSAVETIPGDTDLHAAPDTGASHAACRPVDYSGDRNKRARTVVAALRPAVVAHAGGFVPVQRAVVPGSAEHVDDFAPSAVAVARAADPDSAGRAGGFAPNAVAVPADSVAHAGGSVPSVDSAQLAALRVALHAGAVVRRVARRPAAAQPDVAAVALAVAARALAVALRDELPVPLASYLFVPDFPGFVLARGHGALERS